jgi:hypothetical protein
MRQAVFCRELPSLMEAGAGLGCRLLKQIDMPISGDLTAFASA